MQISQRVRGNIVAQHGLAPRQQQARAADHAAAVNVPQRHYDRSRAARVPAVTQKPFVFLGFSQVTGDLPDQAGAFGTGC